jgi:hypothetical protein
MTLDIEYMSFIRTVIRMFQQIKHGVVQEAGRAAILAEQCCYIMHHCSVQITGLLSTNVFIDELYTTLFHQAP